MYKSMAAVYWLCEGSIINCLLIGGLSERSDEIIVNIRIIFEINMEGTESSSQLIRRKDPGILSFCLGQVIFYQFDLDPLWVYW